MNELLLPCTRGSIGDWIYYSCLMKFKDVAERVGYAERIYGNKNLNKLVQRELKKGRARQICTYLTSQPQRFFGSLIIASHGGTPEWFELSNLKAVGYEALTSVPEEIVRSIGILKLSGEESLFVLDGQHRLSGIQLAIKADKSLGNDEVNVIFVAHREDDEGRERSRRLFTTLNKKAVPVRTGEIIALDEDDVIAITTRRLVREHPLFTGQKVSDSTSSTNIPIKDTKCFTTLAALYGVLSTIFTKIRKDHKIKALRGEDPDVVLGESDCADYYDFAANFFNLLANAYPELKMYMEASDDNLDTLVKGLRRKDGGHLLFRPVGLKTIVEAIAALSTTNSLSDSIKLVAKCPIELSSPPFANVLWLVSANKINHKGVSLATRLIQYMLDVSVDTEKLLEDYEAATGQQVGIESLPKLKTV